MVGKRGLLQRLRRFVVGVSVTAFVGYLALTGRSTPVLPGCVLEAQRIVTRGLGGADGAVSADERAASAHATRSPIHAAKADSSMVARVKNAVVALDTAAR